MAIVLFTSVLHFTSSCSKCFEFSYWYPFETSFLQFGHPWPKGSLLFSHFFHFRCATNPHIRHVHRHAVLRVAHCSMIPMSMMSCAWIDVEVLAWEHWRRCSLCALPLTLFFKKLLYMSGLVQTGPAWMLWRAVQIDEDIFNNVLQKPGEANRRNSTNMHSMRRQPKAQHRLLIY